MHPNTKRNKNIQEILRIGQKPAKTKIYKPSRADKIKLPRKGGGGAKRWLLMEGLAARIRFWPLRFNH